VPNNKLSSRKRNRKLIEIIHLSGLALKINHRKIPLHGELNAGNGVEARDVHIFLDFNFFKKIKT
jgi:hypothetical protein